MIYCSTLHKYFYVIKVNQFHLTLLSIMYRYRVYTIHPLGGWNFDKFNLMKHIG